MHVGSDLVTPPAFDSNTVINVRLETESNFCNGFFVISISVSSVSKREQQGRVVSPLLFVHMHWMNLQSDVNCLDFS